MNSNNEATTRNDVPDVTSEILQGFEQLKLDPHPPRRGRSSKLQKRVGKSADDQQGVFESCMSAVNVRMKEDFDSAEGELQGGNSIDFMLARVLAQKLAPVLA